MSRRPQLRGIRKFTERKETGCCAGMHIACDTRLYRAVHRSASCLCRLSTAYSSARSLCSLAVAPVQRRQRMEGFLRLTGNNRLRARRPAGTSRRRPGCSCRRTGTALCFPPARRASALSCIAPVPYGNGASCPPGGFCTMTTFFFAPDTRFLFFFGIGSTISPVRLPVCRTSSRCSALVAATYKASRVHRPSDRTPDPG